jgi:5,10-methylenetetrahydromethanopterin reductase
MKRAGLAFNDEISLKEAARLTVLAEKRGFESIWVFEDYYYRDAISRMTYLATVSEKIKLATGVVNPHTRSPPLLAMSFITLDELSNNRSILGIGPSARLWLYEKHRPALKQLTYMKECVEIFRKLTSGEKVNYKGRYFDIQNVKLGLKPSRDHVPVYFGVMGPKMLQLAGKMADGVLLTAGATPEYVEWTLKQIKIGAEKSGRDPSEIDLASLIMISVVEDEDAEMETLRSKVAFLALLPQFDPILKLSGLDGLDDIDGIREAGRRGDIEGAAKLVPDELMEKMAIYGTKKECSRRLRAFEDAGVNLPVLVPHGEMSSIENVIKAMS